MVKTKESGILFHTFSHWQVRQDKSLCIFILNSILQVWVRHLSYHGIRTIPDEHPRYNQIDTDESSRSKGTNIPTITKEQSLIALHLTVHSYELCLFGTDNVKHLPESLSFITSIIMALFGHLGFCPDDKEMPYT